jgi:hypothetical protein
MRARSLWTVLLNGNWAAKLSAIEVSSGFEVIAAIRVAFAACADRIAD